MNLLIQAATTLAAFAAAHERVIELIRSFNDRLSAAYRSWQRIGAWIDRHTIGPGNVIIAIGLAFATQASLLALFTPANANVDQAQFFTLFLSIWTGKAGSGSPWTLFDAIGYILMGLTTGLGSQTLHDFANTLIDVRQRLQGVTAQAAGSGVPVQPSTLFVVPTGGGGTAPAPVALAGGTAPSPPPASGALVVT